MNNAYREKFNEVDSRHDQSQVPKPRDDYAPRVQRPPQTYTGWCRVPLAERARNLYSKRESALSHRPDREQAAYELSRCVLEVLMETDRLRKQVTGHDAHDAIDRIERLLASVTGISRGALFDERNAWRTATIEAEKRSEGLDISTV